MKEEEGLYSYDDQFRNTIATVDEHGKRIWIYPKKPAGQFHLWRIFVTIVLLGALISGPFIMIGGRPLFLFNFFDRKFILFGQLFWPQDFVVLAILLLTFFVFIILFTVVFGRIWCGWMCPQTLFMELVFRKIEYLIEGSAIDQRKLNDGPLNGQKIFKKSLKHFIFLIISSFIAHLVMAYMIGAKQTLAIVTSSPGENMAGFIGITSFTFIFYYVFAFFREQVCIVVCPYGRLQGVLLVKESIVVAYDWIRGEPRGKIKKNQATTEKKGDCIDCKLCVHVCPTGIDIRNGTQLECVNCTACIDACDDVMVKIGKPKGLIRYASFNSIKDGVQKLINPRVIGYSLVLVALLSLLGFTLLTRSDIETNVFKVPGTLYQKTDDGYITNLYSIEFVNKTFESVSLQVKANSPSQAVITCGEGNSIVVPAEAMHKIVCYIKMPVSEIKSARTVIMVGVYKGDELIENVEVKFIGPVGKSSGIKK